MFLKEIYLHANPCTIILYMVWNYVESMHFGNILIQEIKFYGS
jgi:hypothetical protein